MSASVSAPVIPVKSPLVGHILELTLGAHDKHLQALLSCRQQVTSHQQVVRVGLAFQYDKAGQ